MYQRIPQVTPAYHLLFPFRGTFGGILLGFLLLLLMSDVLENVLRLWIKRSMCLLDFEILVLFAVEVVAWNISTIHGCNVEYTPS